MEIPIVVVNAMQVPSRENPTLVPKPLSGHSKYDIPGGSIIQIWLMNRDIYEGICFLNPSNDDSRGRIIKMLNAFKVDVNGKAVTAPVNGVLEFYREEIHKVFILENGRIINKQEKEFVMQTFVVKTRAQFKSLMNALASGVSEVSVKMFGESLGRFMNVYWIILCVRDTLIPLDIRELESERLDVWIELKDNLFENEKIVKILHNLRSESDSLFHCKKGVIEMKNVFDTQMAVYFLDQRTLALYNREGRNIPLEENTVRPYRLSICLKRYLGTVVRQNELTLMDMYENKNMTYEQAFTRRPLPESYALKYMALSVKYLIRLKAELQKAMLKCYDTCCENLMYTMKQANINEAMNYLLNDDIIGPTELVAEVKYLSTVLNLEEEVPPESELINQNNTNQEDYPSEPWYMNTVE